MLNTEKRKPCLHCTIYILWIWDRLPYSLCRHVSLGSRQPTLPSNTKLEGGAYGCGPVQSLFFFTDLAYCHIRTVRTAFFSKLAMISITFYWIQCNIKGTLPWVNVPFWKLKSVVACDFMCLCGTKASLRESRPRQEMWSVATQELWIAPLLYV